MYARTLVFWAKYPFNLRSIRTHYKTLGQIYNKFIEITDASSS